MFVHYDRSHPDVRSEDNYIHKPIVKSEDLKSFDDKDSNGDNWATAKDDIDYNKRLKFSDDEDSGEDDVGRGGKDENRKGDQEMDDKEKDRREREYMERARREWEEGGRPFVSIQLFCNFSNIICWYFCGNFKIIIHNKLILVNIIKYKIFVISPVLYIRFGMV